MDKLTPSPFPLGNIVFETYIGNTRCIVCDDFCPVGEETLKRTEQSKINIGRIWYEAEKSNLLRQQNE